MSPRVRRNRTVLAVLIAVTGVVVALVVSRPPSTRTASPRTPVAGPGLSTGSTSTTATPTSTTTPTRASTTTTTTPKPKQTSYGIGELTTTFTEPGKGLAPPHSPGGTVAVVRQFNVDILYPSSAGSATSPTAGAAPASRGGPFPLLLFGPGYDEPTQAYLPLLDAWAAHGYVVAAVTFPLTNPSAPGGLYRQDLPNQPGDLAAAAQGVGADNANASSPLHGLVNTSEVAAIGQSDGGDTALALAYNTCCQLLHVQALVILSGGEPIHVPFPGTWFAPSSPATPLLAFQGTADVTNPPSYTNQYFASAPQPKYLVCLPGVGHLQAYTSPNNYEALVATASIDFLDHELRGHSGALTAMRSAVAASGLGQLATACATG